MRLPTPGGARYRLPILAGLTMVSIALAAWIGRGAGRWLVIERGIARCDLMVVPKGGAVERLSAAADLMSGGACGKVLMTGEPRADGTSHAGSFLAEIDPNKLVHASREANSTFEDAIIAREAVEREGYRSVLVLTSAYHTRRAAWAFDLVFASSGVAVGVIPVSEFYMDSNRWWAAPYGRRAVIGEYAKLLLYGFCLSALMCCATLGAGPLF